MISLILPYYDRQAATDRSLDSIAAAYAGKLDMEIILVDDGSPVPFREVMQYPFPGRVVSLPEKGYPLNPCVPINRGVRASSGDVIVISNPEIIHDTPVLIEMLAEFERLGPDGYVLAAAWCPEEQAWHCHSSIAGDRPSGEKQPPGSGFHFCAMLHRSLWDRAGGFDEDYRNGAGYDDPDWANRVARAGAKFVIRDDLVVTHPRTDARTAWPPGAFERNRALFFAKWPQVQPQPLTVVCVQVGDYCGLGVQYVNNLFAMVARNLPFGLEGKFVCYTDDPGLPYNPAIHVRELPRELHARGWFAKLFLFAPDQFDEGERILFLDLDTIIVGPLDELTTFTGDFAILRDFHRPDGYGSGAMMWRGGFGSTIWSQWWRDGAPDIDGGDQAWIERCVIGADLLQDVFPGTFVSYKLECHTIPPAGAKVVCFHGPIKPHNAGVRWVDAIWNENEAGGFSIAIEGNTYLGTIREQIVASGKRGLARLTSKLPRQTPVAIVGGGPSVANYLDEIEEFSEACHPVWALNGSAHWLRDQNITPDALVVLDARPENAQFAAGLSPGTKAYLASQCHPDVFDIVDANDIVRVDLDVMGDCGTTVGMLAMAIAFTEGYRTIHLYGYDSSYADGEGHAYRQDLNGREVVAEVTCGDRTFHAAPWMFRQAQDFQSLALGMMAKGAEIIVHGDGLIPHLARELSLQITH